MHWRLRFITLVSKGRFKPVNQPQSKVSSIYTVSMFLYSSLIFYVLALFQFIWKRPWGLDSKKSVLMSSFLLHQGTPSRCPSSYNLVHLIVQREKLWIRGVYRELFGEKDEKRWITTERGVTEIPPDADSYCLYYVVFTSTLSRLG